MLVSLRRKTADVFFSYSIAGPSYLSKQVIDREDIGNKFSFQDIMGFGMFVGGYIPVLWGASSWGVESLLFGGVGAVAGIWLGLRVSE